MVRLDMHMWPWFDTWRRISCAGNIRVQQWLPQQDLLGHPAVKLFLSHGGIHSMYESLWHGTPMVLMPIATDQFDNSRYFNIQRPAASLSRLQRPRGTACWSSTA